MNSLNSKLPFCYDNIRLHILTHTSCTFSTPITSSHLTSHFSNPVSPRFDYFNFMHGTGTPWHGTTSCACCRCCCCWSVCLTTAMRYATPIVLRCCAMFCTLYASVRTARIKIHFNPNSYWNKRYKNSVWNWQNKNERRRERQRVSEWNAFMFFLSLDIYCCCCFLLSSYCSLFIVHLQCACVLLCLAGLVVLNFLPFEWGKILPSPT